MYISFAIPVLAVMILCSATIPLAMILPIILFQENWLLGVIVLTIVEIFIISFMLLVYGRSLVIVTIDEKGIRNRRVKLRWEEIGAAKAVEIEANKFRPSIFNLRGIDVACFSLGREEGTFFSLSTKRVVMIRMSKKNYEVISKYGRGKSEVVAKFLESIDWYKYRE